MFDLDPSADAMSLVESRFPLGSEARLMCDSEQRN